MSLKNKFKSICKSLYSVTIPILCDLGIIKPNVGINKSEERPEKVIVSLTSYGRRVKKTVYYTIISLLKQNYKPDKIILWLDNQNWNDYNIPRKLKNLRKYGLTIKFCDDIKSYKKLIPAIKEFPNDIIITCDDDVYYNADTIGILVSNYLKEPNSIYCHCAHLLTFDSNNILNPYSKWEKYISSQNNKRVFPVGVGAVLYKKDFLHNDVTDENKFMELAPRADDIWFYIMSFLKGINKTVVPVLKDNIYNIDLIHQKFNKYSSLSGSNVADCQNDIQIRDILKYYGIKDSDLQ